MSKKLLITKHGLSVWLPEILFQKILGELEYFTDEERLALLNIWLNPGSLEYADSPAFKDMQEKVKIIMDRVEIFDPSSLPQNTVNVGNIVCYDDYYQIVDDFGRLQTPHDKTHLVQVVSQTPETNIDITSVELNGYEVADLIGKTASEIVERGEEPECFRKKVNSVWTPSEFVAMMQVPDEAKERGKESSVQLGDVILVRSKKEEFTISRLQFTPDHLLSPQDLILKEIQHRQPEPKPVLKLRAYDYDGKCDWDNLAKPYFKAHSAPTSQETERLVGLTIGSCFSKHNNDTIDSEIVGTLSTETFEKRLGYVRRRTQ